MGSLFFNFSSRVKKLFPAGVGLSFKTLDKSGFLQSLQDS